LTFVVLLNSFYKHLFDTGVFSCATFQFFQEGHMARKKGKSVSFDAMVKFFLQYYNIPTRRDIDKIMAKMDRIETLIKQSATSDKPRRVPAGKTAKDAASDGKPAMTSSDMALDIIKRFKKGIGFAEIQAKTGFEDKKLRNIIFRLHKMGKIVRKRRGIYIAV